MYFFLKPLILIFSLLLTINSHTAFAQESWEVQARLTSETPQISLDTLDIMMAPLTVTELKTEADGWLKLIKASAHIVADAKLRIKNLSQHKGNGENAQAQTT